MIPTPSGWRLVTGQEAEELTSQFLLEVGDRTIGERLGPRAYARDDGSDDVAYLCREGTVLLAHLQWTEEATTWFRLYSGIAAFCDALDDRPFADATCVVCGSDWGAGEARKECSCCGGHALSRACPVCGGRCGAVWTRAVLDSNDSRSPVWLGHCREPE